MTFNNLRSEWRTCWLNGVRRQGQNLELSILNEFIKEAQMHHHEYKDKVFVLESRDESEATRQIA